jgi:hypothetical protein
MQAINPSGINPLRTRKGQENPGFSAVFPHSSFRKRTGRKQGGLSFRLTPKFSIKSFSKRFGSETISQQMCQTLRNASGISGVPETKGF